MILDSYLDKAKQIAQDKGVTVQAVLLADLIYTLDSAFRCHSNQQPPTVKETP